MFHAGFDASLTLQSHSARTPITRSRRRQEQAMATPQVLWVKAVVLASGLLLLAALGIAASLERGNFLSLFVMVFFLLVLALPTLIVLYADRNSGYFDRLPEGHLLSKCPVSVLVTTSVFYLYFGFMSWFGDRIGWNMTQFAALGIAILVVPMLIEECGRTIHAALKSPAREVS
jgi:cation transport ATPase